MGKVDPIAKMYVNLFYSRAQDFVALCQTDQTIGPFLDAIDCSVQNRIQGNFLSFVKSGKQDFPSEEMATEFAKPGFDLSDFDAIYKIYQVALAGMLAGEPERCLKIIEGHKAVFLGQNLDKR
jgi:hypothetical protein